IAAKPCFVWVGRMTKRDLLKNMDDSYTITTPFWALKTQLHTILFIETKIGSRKSKKFLR
ncbi:MAG TPA: hypothetical protein V6C65_16565, partial [Allocoleopsis sp.]